MAAHPDDEVLALGGHFGIVHPRIFHLTTGGGFLPIPRLAERRGAEVRRALALGRIPRRRFIPGVLSDQGALDAIPELVHRLRTAVQHLAPDCLLTHAYEGGHPDHDAASLICRLVAQGRFPIYEFPSYFNGTPELPRAFFQTHKFLASSTPEVTLPLSPRQQGRKRRMLRCFRSQAEFLKRFSVAEERFRIAPLYNYEKPPHEGTLLYESFGWRINYRSWKSAVDAAMQTLGTPLHV